jgi:Xaa-Pro aminopeptidase
MNDPFAVDIAACRGRQRRLLEYVLPLEADDQFLTVLTQRESVQWLTGAFVRPPFAPIAAITRSGHVTLVLPEHQQHEAVAADEIIGYEGKRHSTMIDEHRDVSTAMLKAKFPGPWKYIACEHEAIPITFLLETEPTWMQKIDSDVCRLRRQKDPDEVRLLEKANDANRAMYDHARQIVRPGLNELDLYAELFGVAVHVLGEAPTYFGQDFRFCHGGGPPRNRIGESGELLILDLGVGFRGYHSDNARTIAVDADPTEEQQQAWELVADVFKLIESEARPGKSCRELYESAHRHLNADERWSFNHHLGHGVGLAPHEGPHLNPRWDDVLAEGDFIAVEPGVYSDDLRAGIRLEQNFLITAGEAQLLTDWPLGLTVAD